MDPYILVYNFFLYYCVNIASCIFLLIVDICHSYFICAIHIIFFIFKKYVVACFEIARISIYRYNIYVRTTRWMTECFTIASIYSPMGEVSRGRRGSQTIALPPIMTEPSATAAFTLNSSAKVTNAYSAYASGSSEPRNFLR